MWLNRVNQWANERSLALLKDAYSRAKVIKAIEDKHFGGGKIAPSQARSKSLYDYFKSILARELLQIRLNLTQFRVLNVTGHKNEQEREILENLQFIEDVIGKYRITDEELNVSTTLSLPPVNGQFFSSNSVEGVGKANNSNPKLFFELPKRITPEYEVKVIEQLRIIEKQRGITIRYLALLIIVPFIVQWLSRDFIYLPIIERFKIDLSKPNELYINQEVGERLLQNMAKQKEIYEIKELLGIIPSESPTLKREFLQERARELVKEAARESQRGLGNLLADLTALGSFTSVIYLGRRQFRVMREYINRYFLGLNDVTKVFIFMLITDMFVGFHSVEGWEVILNSLFQHFGLPESRNFNYVFIATVPVILDCFLKLLIFNYLTRKSPTSVAILEKMNQ